MILSISDLRGLAPTDGQIEIQGLRGRHYSGYQPQTGEPLDAWWCVEHDVPLRFERRHADGKLEVWEPRVYPAGAGRFTSDAWRGLPSLPQLCGLPATG